MTSHSTNIDDLRNRVNKLLDFFTEPGQGEKYLRDLEDDLVDLMASQQLKLLDELEKIGRGRVIVDDRDGWKEFAELYVNAIQAQREAIEKGRKG